MRTQLIAVGKGNNKGYFEVLHWDEFFVGGGGTKAQVLSEAEIRQLVAKGLVTGLEFNSQGSLVGSNGSLDRYPNIGDNTKTATISIRERLNGVIPESNVVHGIILARTHTWLCGDGYLLYTYGENGCISYYSVDKSCNMVGNLSEIIQAVTVSKHLQIANAKIVDGHISSIKGSFPYIDYKYDSSITEKSRYNVQLLNTKNEIVSKIIKHTISVTANKLNKSHRYLYTGVNTLHKGGEPDTAIIVDLTSTRMIHDEVGYKPLVEYFAYSIRITDLIELVKLGNVDGLKYITETNGIESKYTIMDTNISEGAYTLFSVKQFNGLNYLISTQGNHLIMADGKLAEAKAGAKVRLVDRLDSNSNLIKLTKNKDEIDMIQKQFGCIANIDSNVKPSAGNEETITNSKVSKEQSKTAKKHTGLFGSLLN